ncbi:hypothetical protein Q9Q99_12510 [Curtobacterium flaccumfaciens]|nr:hypothetical protein Q9Q99_12510 [Curtobacterium flaccumfaciens]
MDIAGSVALVTGSNRGIGRRFALQLLERGATKVYATARRPELVDIEGRRGAAAQHHRPGIGRGGGAPPRATSPCS